MKRLTLLLALCCTLATPAIADNGWGGSGLDMNDVLRIWQRWAVAALKFMLPEEQPIRHGLVYTGPLKMPQGKASPLRCVAAHRVADQRYGQVWP